MKAEFILGRPGLNSVSMHLHVEFLIMEAVLEHPDQENASRNTPQCVMYVQTGGQYALTSLFLFLEKKPFQLVEGLSYFWRPLRCHVMQINKM